MKKVILFVLISILAFYLGQFTFSPDYCTELVMHTGYWFILGAVCMFSLFLFKQLKSYFSKYPVRWNELKKSKFLVAALVILAASVLTRVHEPTEFKILMDEPALASVGTTMHLKRQAFVPVRAHHIMGNYTILSGYVDKRPLLFPFLVATVHDLTGYRADNAFYLNMLLTPIFFTLLFLFVYKMGGLSCGILSILLALCLPLLHRTANGAGFELLNLVMILCVMLSGYSYLKKPTRGTLSLLCLSMVLLSQVRYESILYIVPVAMIILVGWLRTKKPLTSWVFFVTPLLFTPYLWQHHTFTLQEGFWQLEDIKTATTPFAFSYIYNNIGHALNFFLDFSHSFPNSPLLIILGSLSGGLFLLFLYKKIKHKEINNLSDLSLTFAIFFTGFSLYFILILSYFYGQLDHAIIHRLSLPTHIPMILAICWLYAYQNKTILKKWLYGLTVGSFLIFTVPSVASHQYSQTYLPTQEASWVMEFSKQNKEHLFVISDRPAIWAINKVDTLPAGLANKRKEAVKYYLSQPSSPTILVNQVCKYDAETKSLKSTLDLDKDFVTEPYLSQNLSELYQIQLLRVTDVLNTEAVQPSEEEALLSSNEASYLHSWAKNLP